MLLFALQDSPMCAVTVYAAAECGKALTTCRLTLLRTILSVDAVASNDGAAGHRLSAQVGLSCAASLHSGSDPAFRDCLSSSHRSGSCRCFRKSCSRGQP